MADVQELLRIAAGGDEASFGATDVWQRSRAIRRRRIISFATIASVVVVVVFWIAGSQLELFRSAPPDPATPVRPTPTETILVYSKEGDIFVLSGLDGEPENVTTSSEEELNPAISPDGRTIVFERVEGPDSATNWGLHSIPVEGGESLRLTSGSRDIGFDREPAWSPDGSRIAFVRHIGAGSEILGTDTALVVMNADGSDQQEVTERPGGVSGPAWSLDGRRIFFTYSSAREAAAVRAVDADAPSDPVARIAEGFTPAPMGFLDVAFLRTQSPRVTDVYRYVGRTAKVRRLTEGLQAHDLSGFGNGAVVVASATPTRLFVVREGRDPEPLLEGANPFELEGPNPHLRGFSVFVPDAPKPSTPTPSRATELSEEEPETNVLIAEASDGSWAMFAGVDTTSETLCLSLEGVICSATSLRDAFVLMSTFDEIQQEGFVFGTVAADVDALDLVSSDAVDPLRIRLRSFPPRLRLDHLRFFVRPLSGYSNATLIARAEDGAVLQEREFTWGDASLPSDVFFPTWTGDDRPLAIVTGSLVERDRCLLLRGGGSEVLVLWEEGYTYVEGALRDESGGVVARVGDVIHGGGGYGSDWQQAEGVVGEPIPQRCRPKGAEPYALIYDVERGPPS